MKKTASIIVLVLISICICFVFTACGSHPLKGNWQYVQGQEDYNVISLDTLTFDTDFLGRCYFSFAGEKAYLSDENQESDGVHYNFSYSQKTGGGTLLAPEARGFSIEARLDESSGELILISFSCSKMNGYEDVSSHGFTPVKYSRA